MLLLLRRKKKKKQKRRNKRSNVKLNEFVTVDCIPIQINWAYMKRKLLNPTFVWIFFIKSGI